MLKNILRLVIVSLMFLSCSVLADNEGNLNVFIKGFDNSNGTARVAIFNSEDSFRDAGFTTVGALYAASLPIVNGQVVWHLKDLPYNAYAIKVFHDVNNDGEMKKNFFNVPEVGFGFSNNPMNTKGTITFQQAVFLVNAKQQQITIQIRHSNVDVWHFLTKQY